MVAAMAMTSAVCHAMEFGRLHADKSSITFVSKQMGVPIEGKFGKFDAQIAFNPDHPDTTKAQIRIEMASIDAGNPDADEAVRSRGWFNIEQFKTAKFESVSIKPNGSGRYEATGNMTIKGVTQPVKIPFAIKLDSNIATLEGNFPISRKQFGIGTADWTDIVGDEVRLQFHINLGPIEK